MQLYRKRLLVVGATDMLYKELMQIICLVMNQGLHGQALMGMLIATVNPAEICASNDMLVTDSCFSLLHVATEEELVTDAEWKYFLQCLNGERNYSPDEKLHLTELSSARAAHRASPSVPRSAAPCCPHLQAAFPSRPHRAAPSARTAAAHGRTASP